MNALSPSQLVTYTSMSFVVAPCLSVAAELGVADYVGEQPTSVDELAQAVGAHPESLGRLLRVLSDHGIFQRQSAGFSHTEASQLLRSDHPQSLRMAVKVLRLPWYWSVFLHLQDAVRSGNPVLDQVLPEGIWARLETHADEARLFNEGMTARAHQHVVAALATYDFSRFGTIGDIGGGRGHLIAAILERNPDVNGVLFDLPHVVQTARGLVSTRLRLEGGDFFKDPLPACDAYTLMEVIHDWSDSDSVRILGAVRRAAAKGAKLLLIEQMLPEAPIPNVCALVDIAMMTIVGGKQRSRAEYEKLYEAAGFQLDAVIAMPSSTASIIEGTAA